MSTLIRKNLSDETAFVYQTTIGKTGLIRVKSSIHRSDNKVVIMIISNQNYELSVIGSIGIDRATQNYNWAQSRYHNTPFYVQSDISDCKYSDDYTKVEISEKFYGGNRVLIDIREPGKYVINIPHDTDLEITQDTADIRYNTDRKTRLHVECTSVNIPGDCGCSIPGSESWDYYSLGTIGDPITDIQTKGNVEIKALTNSDPVHLECWKKSNGH